MIMYVETSIWESPAQTLVNTVNTVGAMGKGIALQFKKTYPDMYDKYRQLCKEKKIDIGKLWLYRADGRNVLNFPTKKHWRYPSKIEYIEDGLKKFIEAYEIFNITSISFPQLGTGHGGLDWDTVVQPLMDRYLRRLPIPIYIHLVRKRVDFVPEHKLPLSEAIPFDVLIDDIKSLQGRVYKTMATGSSFVFGGIEGEYLFFFVGANKNKTKIPIGQLRIFWDDLNRKRIHRPADSIGQVAKNYSYLMPLLNSIEYLKSVNVSNSHELLFDSPSIGLMVHRRKGDRKERASYELPC